MIKGLAIVRMVAVRRRQHAGVPAVFGRVVVVVANVEAVQKTTEKGGRVVVRGLVVRRCRTTGCCRARPRGGCRMLERVFSNRVTIDYT
jgi:hypothetical protein